MKLGVDRDAHTTAGREAGATALIPDPCRCSLTAPRLRVSYLLRHSFWNSGVVCAELAQWTDAGYRKDAESKWKQSGSWVADAGLESGPRRAEY